jgi:hypothetical protein
VSAIHSLELATVSNETSTASVGSYFLTPSYLPSQSTSNQSARVRTLLKLDLQLVDSITLLQLIDSRDLIKLALLQNKPWFTDIELCVYRALVNFQDGPLPTSMKSLFMQRENDILFEMLGQSLESSVSSSGAVFSNNNNINLLDSIDLAVDSTNSSKRIIQEDSVCSPNAINIINLLKTLKRYLTIDNILPKSNVNQDDRPP